MPTPILCLFILSLCTACSTPARRAGEVKLALDPYPAAEVDYRAWISPAGLPVAQPPQTQGDPSQNESVQIQTSFSILQMEASVAEALLPTRSRGTQAYLLPRDEAESIIPALGALNIPCYALSSPCIVTNSTQRGTLCTVDQEAYIASFELAPAESDPATLIADPIVEVVSSGMILEMCATLEDVDQIQLVLRLELADKTGPMAHSRVRLPGVSSHVTIQNPLFMHHELQAGALIPPDHALVLGPWPASDEGRSYFLFAMVQPVPIAGEGSELLPGLGPESAATPQPTPTESR